MSSKGREEVAQAMMDCVRVYGETVGLLVIGVARFWRLMDALYHVGGEMRGEARESTWQGIPVLIVVEDDNILLAVPKSMADQARIKLGATTPSEKTAAADERLGKEAKRIEDERTCGISGILAHQEMDAEQQCKEIGPHNLFCKHPKGHDGAHWDGRWYWGVDKAKAVCSHHNGVSGCICQLPEGHGGAHCHSADNKGYRWDNPCGHEHSVGFVCTREKHHPGQHADAKGATWYTCAEGLSCLNQYSDRQLFCTRPQGHQGKHRAGQAEWWTEEIHTAPKCDKQGKKGRCKRMAGHAGMHISEPNGQPWGDDSAPVTECGHVYSFAHEGGDGRKCTLPQGHKGKHRNGDTEWKD